MPESTSSTTATTTAKTTAPAAAYDGEQLGSLIFDVRADFFEHCGGLWVYPASYDDLRLCRRRAASLQESYPGVEFFALRIKPAYLHDGASPAIACSGYYAATLATNTDVIRSAIAATLARAAAFAPVEGEA